MKSHNGRRLNPKLPVRVYRNVTKGGYSVCQGNRVVAHCDECTLLDATFHVNDGGRQRVLKTGVKNVHAWVKGTLVTGVEAGSLPLPVTYNPKRDAAFVTDAGTVVHNARLVTLGSRGVTAWRINDW